MKALSIRSPYAGQILSDEKKVEYRTWTTNYRGDLLVCCSQSPKSGYSGKAVCIVELYKIDEDPKYDEYRWHLRNVRPVKPFAVKGRLGIFEVELPKKGGPE
jgi:hypothetical protein